MHSASRYWLWLLIGGLMLAVGAGCGSGSGTSLPKVKVTSMVPADGSTAVHLSASVSVTFNQQMNQSTINSSTFSLSDPASAIVPGTIDYNSFSFTATFTPISPLAPNTTYKAAVSGGVANVANATLGTDVTWSFTTGTTP
jgi:Bacterial Ig-like domain